MPAQRLTIGVAVDTDLGTVFRPLIESAKRARKEIDDVFTGSPAFGGGAGRGVGRAAGGPGGSSAAIKDGEKWVQEGRRQASQRVRDEQKALGDIEKEFQKHAKERERIGDQIALNEIRASQRAAKEAGVVRQRVAGAVGQSLSRMAGAGLGIAGQMARGAGINFDIAGGVQKRGELQSLATQVSNSGYMEGKAGANGTRVDPKDLMKQAQEIGLKTATGPQELMEGLAAFVSKTGDLKAARDTMESMAVLSKATGASFEDMTAAAAAVSNKLGDVQNKGEIVSKVMTAFAGQGKVGAVEIKDLASKMEKLTALSTRFAGDSTMTAMAGGNATGGNIAMMGVLAQAARKDSRTTAGTASQSAMAFVRDLESPAAAKRFEAKGIKRYTDGSETQLRGVQDLVKDILVKSQGSGGKLAQIMGNQNSRAIPMAFMDSYKQGHDSLGKGATEKEREAAGMAAVDKQFEELKLSTMKAQEVQDSFAAAMATTKSQAEVFQQQLDKMVGDLSEKILPKLNELIPMATQLLGAFSGLVTWAVSNPFAAAFSALGASIMKSVGEEILKNLASKALTGGVTQGFMGVLQGSTGLATGLNTAAAGLGIFAAAVAVTALGMHEIDKAIDAIKAGQDEQRKTDLEAFNTPGSIAAAEKEHQLAQQRGPVTPEEESKYQATKADAAEKIRKEKELITKGEAYENSGTASKVFKTVNAAGEALFGNTAPTKDLAETKAAADHLNEMKGTMSRVEKLLGGTLRVQMGGGVAVDDGARTK